MSLLEIRIGEPIHWGIIKNEYNPNWGENIDSAYVKSVVGPSVKINWYGPEGNSAGFPGHIADAINRAVLVYNELTYKTLQDVFPNSTSSLCRGGFGENFVVDHPDLLPSVVCIGDIYSIGTAIFRVSGPRAPCPKVDKWHKATGMTKLTKSKGLAGYFLKVVQEGSVSVCDKITLLKRPRPGFTIERISEGLWGDNGIDGLDNTIEFLEAVSNMDELIGRHYRDTAATRLSAILHPVESNNSSTARECAVGTDCAAIPDYLVPVATDSSSPLDAPLDSFFHFLRALRDSAVKVYEPLRHNEDTVMAMLLWVQRWAYLIGIIFFPSTVRHPLHYQELLWVYGAMLGQLMVSYGIQASQIALPVGVGIISCNRLVFGLPVAYFLCSRVVRSVLSGNFEFFIGFYGLWLLVITLTILVSLYIDAKITVACTRTKPNKKIS